MSRIVELRTQIMDAIRDGVPELNQVDWYDGLFDEKDVNAWVVDAPACFVAVKRVPGYHLSTGELHCPMNCLATIIVEDEHSPRDADEKLWAIMEKVVVLVNLNAFGNPNSALATDLKFERLLEPELRRQGVALGVVEWVQTMTLGINRSRQRMFYTDPNTGQTITQTPRQVTGEGKIHTVTGETSTTEQVPLMDPASQTTHNYPWDNKP
jgi:hypothetical protein